MSQGNILITGGSSGIGLAIAQKCLQEGYGVHITGRNMDRLKTAHVDLGPNSCIYCGDLGNPQDVRTTAAQVLETTNGSLDGLVLNAAGYGMGPVESVGQNDMAEAFRVNLFGGWGLVQACLPALRKGSGKSIVWISSTLAGKPVPGAGLYSATKAAVNSLAKSMAMEFAADHIRVNVISPGVVDTPIHEPKSEQDPSRQAKLEQLAPLHLLGRVGQPEDVAAMATFLLSPQSGWVTGSEMTVDGGISLA